jgi:photosystem II stability/assembly factor-like uncharacterized protein
MNKLSILLILLVLNIIKVQAQWEETNGPYGGVVRNIIIMPSGTGGKNVFANIGYIVLSTDNGISWNAANTGIQKGITNLSVSSDGKIFSAGGKGVIYLSTNNGTSWSETSNGLPNLVVGSLAFGPDGKGGTNIYAGMSNNITGGEISPSVGSGVYYSTDMGISWKNIGIEDSYWGISALLAVPNGTGGTDLFVGKANDDNGVCLYHTSNNGASWDSLRGIYSILTMAAGPNGKGSTNIYLGTGLGRVYISSDTGKSWISGIVSNGYIYCLSVNGSDVYAGTSGFGVYHSTDMGINWTQINSGLFNKMVLSIAADDSNIFAGTNASGIFVSTNNGESWFPRNQGLQKRWVNSLAVIGNNLYAGTHGNGVHLSTNNGERWSEANNGLANWMVTALALNPNETGGQDIWAATELGISVSTDNGESWITPDNELRNAFVLSLAVKGKTLFAGIAGDGAWLSTNYGSSWNQASKGLEHTSMGGDPYESIYSFAFSGNNIIAGTKYAGMFLSTNNGTSWSLVKLPIPWPYTNIDINSLTTISDGNGGINILAATDKGILISTDNGVNWSFSNSGLPAQPSCTTIGKIPDGKGGTNIIVDGDPNMYLSADSGKSWSAVEPALPGATYGIYSFAVKDNYLYAGTFNIGVIRCPLSSIITDVKKTEAIPTAFSLEQNYPNPFNPSTNISYTLPGEGKVRIRVYDVLGREVVTLLDGVVGSGKHSIYWNGSNSASGIYFYSISFKGQTLYKKMVLMK